LRGKWIKYVFSKTINQGETKPCKRKKEKKQEKKKYTKMVLNKHNKLKNITAQTTGDLGCTKFHF